MNRKIIRKITAVTAALSVLAASAGVLYNPAGNVSASELLGETGFDYKAYPWHTVEASPAKQNFELDNGAFHILILNAEGNDRESWDLEFRHRKLNFKQGHRYKVSFKAKAKREGMELCSRIGNLKGDEDYFVLMEDGMRMGPAMGGQWGTAAKLSTEWKEYSGEFIPDKDIEAAEWVFYYASGTQYFGNAQDGDELWFDEMSVNCESCYDCVYTEGPFQNYITRNLSGTDNDFISVNQLGYYNNLSKIAVLSDNSGDIVHNSVRTDLMKELPDFELVDVNTDKVVFTGKPGPVRQDMDSGDRVCRLDFSEFTESGTYYIRAGEWRSPEFRIGNDIYSEKDHNMLIDAVNYFYQNRSGIRIENEYITSGERNKEYLAHIGGHITDSAHVQKEWKGEYYANGEASHDYASSEITASGGWYEADTHGKYVVNNGIALWTLQNMYENAVINGKGAKFDDASGIIAVPESGNGVPDILDEAAYELDWMSEMVVKEDEPEWGGYAGMVYHSVQDHRYTGIATRPWDYEDEWSTVRIVKPPTFAATLNYAACAAQAARLWKPYSSEKAEKYLSEAKKAFDAYELNYYPADTNINMHPDRYLECPGEELNSKSQYAPLYSIDGGTEYGDFDVRDEAYWAACELYVSARVFDDSDADRYFKRLSEYNTGSDKAFNVRSELPDFNSHGTSMTSFNWRYTASAGSLTLALHRELLSDNAAEALETSLIKAADSYISTEEEQGYGIPYAHDNKYYDPSSSLGAVITEGYEYGSNSIVMNNAVVMAYAYNQTKDEKYLNGVSSAMDYILGTNPLSFSFVTGYGSFRAMSPYHRYWAYELDHTLPQAPDGVLVSGPNAGLQDPHVWSLGFVPGKSSNPSQRCYVDSIESWSTNAVGTNINSPLAWVVSFMQDNGNNAENSSPDDNNKISEITGDVNCDGIVDVTDLSVLSLSLVDSLPLNGQAKINADVDRDGQVHIADLARIRQFVSKVITEF